MPDEKVIHQDCPACGGTGEIYENPDSQAHGGSGPLNPEPCLRCGATGHLVFGRLDDDLITFLQDILDKVNDIKEKVDTL
jgi:hypothetical protein